MSTSAPALLSPAAPQQSLSVDNDDGNPLVMVATSIPSTNDGAPTPQLLQWMMTTAAPPVPVFPNDDDPLAPAFSKVTRTAQPSPLPAFLYNDSDDLSLCAMMTR